MTQNEITVERKKLWDSERLIDYFGYLIIAIGITIILTSTYVNILNSIYYVHFTSPYVINATANKFSAS
jgi:hypothetical protein